MLNKDPLPPSQQLRALVAYLGISEQAAANELGISRTLFKAICLGNSLPDGDCRQRVMAMSMRWPHGTIHIQDWPKPAPADRRKTKPIKKQRPGWQGPIPEGFSLLDPVLSPPKGMGFELLTDDYLDAAPEELDDYSEEECPPSAPDRTEE